MKTKIVSISDDKNTITHESGFVSVFKESGIYCIGCVYYENFDCAANEMPCLDVKRKDGLEGIFINKNH